MPHRKPKRKYSINAYSEEFACDARSVKKWLAAEKIDPTNVRAAKACISRRQKEWQAAHPHGAAGQQSAPDAKPGSNGEAAGRHPLYRKLLAEAERLERKNRIEGLIESKDYVKAADHQRIIQMGIGKIELVPVKLHSEFSLADNLVKRLTALLDEAREAWAKDIFKLDEALTTKTEAEAETKAAA